MARIRSVHPGLFTDEAFFASSPLARLLLIGLWVEADDRGIFEWKPLTLKVRILPADDADVAALLEELAGVRAIAKFDVGDKSYGAVRNFRKFQRPKAPNSVHPLPNEWRQYVGLEGCDPEPAQNPSPNGSKPIPNRFPIASENPFQMEDGGGRMEEERLIDPNGSIVSAGADQPHCESKPSERYPVRKAFENWNIAARELGLPVAQNLTPERQRKIRARLREHGGIETWNRALLQLERSPFLLGKNDREWRADLDFLLQPSSFNKVLDGRYENSR